LCHGDDQGVLGFSLENRYGEGELGKLGIAKVNRFLARQNLPDPRANGYN
jgi:hypothetical protein